MNYAEIKYCDIANGVGTRTTLFVSGCTHHCEDCFQPETWNFDFGYEFDDEVVAKIIESLQPSYIRGLTLLGGEPMEPANQAVLVDFLAQVKEALPDKTVWCFTGDLVEDLLDEDHPRHTDDTMRMLGYIDVLVDGPYVRELHDISLRFRGSSNQRLIDMPATLESGDVVLWEDEEVYTTHTM